MINFYEFEQILQENKTLDKIKVGLKRTGEKIDKLLGDNPHQRQADNRKNNKDKAQFDKMLGDLTKEGAHPYGDWEDHFDNDREANTGITTKKAPKNAPQGRRNAECARCGAKEKAKLYDINAGKAKCKNCGGYLHLITSESVEEGEYYAEYDEDRGMWCVFHTHKHQEGKVTKHRGCFSNKEQAEKHAKKLNNPE